MAPLISRASFNRGFGRRRGGASVGKSIIITMWGAGGGGVSIPGGSPTWGMPAPGGAGGALVATGTYQTFGFTSGQTLYIYVGGGGGGSGGGGGPNGGHPGSGGSGGPGSGWGGGGGMSSLYLNGSFSTGTRLLIAAGGGGYFENIGAYPVGLVPPAFPQPQTNHGYGATQSAGGAAGVSANPSYPPGNAGSQFTGGNGSGAGNAKSGGGGAGWYGGGGGASDTGAANGGAGGGGSNYQNPAIFPIPSVVHANFLFDPWFNPQAANLNPNSSSIGYPSIYTFPGGSRYNPSLGAAYSTDPGYGTGARSTLPGQNAPNPLYSLPYCGGSTVGGAGYPGSVHITVDGVTTSFTSVGPFTYILP